MVSKLQKKCEYLSEAKDKERDTICTFLDSRWPKDYVA